MRYRNWDVLLFPGGSKVPVQEFKTQCFVIKDKDAPFLHTAHLGSLAYQKPLMFNQLPVLSTFIPSLPQDSPFQISVLSWDRPRPSIQFESNMGPEDTVIFEARVYIDGAFASGSLYSQRTAWPQIMDLSSRKTPTLALISKLMAVDPDREGNQDCLRFPPFHSEILQQRTWDAADQYGRVRIVLAEGVSRPNRSPPFERYRDFVTFSFQHAPLQVLEHSEIAWPNNKMWLPVSNTPRYATAMVPYGNSKGYDDHGHSPSRTGRFEARAPAMIADPSSQSSSNTATFSGSSLSAYNAWVPHRGFPIPATQWNRHPQEPQWDPQDAYIVEAGMDNLVDDIAWRQRGARPSREDVAMPDYASTSSSSRPLSSMTGFSFEHSNQPSITACLDDDQYNELIQSLTPTKPAPAAGTRAPSNTPSDAMPPPKLSAAATARSARYTRSCRTSALAYSSQSSIREVSGSSMSIGSEKGHRKECRKEPCRKVSREVFKKIQTSSKDEHVKMDKATQENDHENSKGGEQANLKETASEIAKEAENLIIERLQESMIAEL